MLKKHTAILALTTLLLNGSFALAKGGSHVPIWFFGLALSQ